MRFLSWLTRRLEARWTARAVIALGVALALPSLFAPLVADEHLQAVRWREGRGGVVGFLGDCFVFASGDLAEGRARMEHLGAWWAAPDFRVAFWRPLSAATHALDLALWPGSAALMHAHTLLWFAALLACLDALFRRLMSARAALLALALYAWDDARGGLLSWVANRHALVAGVFCVGALLAHDRWRRDAWRHGAWLGPTLFSLGLLSSEMALATTAFLLGHARWIDREGSVVAAFSRARCTGSCGAPRSAFTSTTRSRCLTCARSSSRSPKTDAPRPSSFDSRPRSSPSAVGGCAAKAWGSLRGPRPPSARPSSSPPRSEPFGDSRALERRSARCLGRGVVRVDVWLDAQNQ